MSDEERREIQRCLDVNEDGRFPCRFPGCNTSFKYNGKSRRRHELSHDPPVVMEEVTTTTSSTTTDQASKSSDDVFNYNAALLSEGLLVHQLRAENLGLWLTRGEQPKHVTY